MEKREGFTIVELLVVIVVIAILAAIAIVVYSNVQNRAQDTALRSDLANAGKVVSLWMVEHTMQELNDAYRLDGATRTAAYITGQNADNELTNRHLRWNTVAALPRIAVSPNATLEVVGQYGNADEADVNERILRTNAFCITGAIRGGTYNYRPMSKPRQYDKLLFFDSAWRVDCRISTGRSDRAKR